MNHRRKSNTSSDIFQILTRDHRLVEQLFKKLESTSSRSSRVRTKLFDELRTELTKHAEAEEQLIYPELKDNRQSKEFGFEAVEEQAVMKDLLKKLSGLSTDDDRWGAVLFVLKEATLRHVEEEEREMFPKMKKIFSKEELRDLGPRFLEAKESLLGQIKRLVGM